MERSARLHRVVALAQPPQSTFELSCAAEVFGIERPGLPARYQFRVCALRPGLVRTRAGYDMHIPAGMSAFRAADTIVVAGWPQRSTPPPHEIVLALQRAHGRGVRIVGICSGTFPIAAAGLLDGRSATTHWRMTDELRQQYPSVTVDPDILYIDHGDVATSAGTAAAIDLCLHLVRVDFGAAYAADIARHMVMPPHRDGGQLQYARPGTVPSVPQSLAPVMEWAVKRLDQPVTVSHLAAQAGLSARSIARRFDQETGVSPGKWLLRQRIAAACALLERTDLTVETIATRVGLSSASNLRRRFFNELRTTPGDYRRNFTTRQSGGLADHPPARPCRLGGPPGRVSGSGVRAPR